jgi:1,4-dihydroxy-2-naphthoyl-CoA synthase
MASRFRASVPLTDDWQHFRFAVADGVATVTLDRPEKLNPLTFESYADLRDLVLQLPHRDDVRVLVVRGEGRAFCAGGDVEQIIGELVRMRPRELMAFTKMTGDLIRAMREVPVPIVAGIQGIAAGAGAVIALASDFRVCARSARFASSSPRWGSPGVTWARPTCCRGWSAPGARPRCSCSATRSTPPPPTATAWSASWSTTPTWTTPSRGWRAGWPPGPRWPTPRPSR